MNQQGRPQGWYPDPDGSGQRYWTGSEWSPPPRASKRNLRVVLIPAAACVVLIVVALVVGLVESSHEDKAAPTTSTTVASTSSSTTVEATTAPPTSFSQESLDVGRWVTANQSLLRSISTSLTESVDSFSQDSCTGLGNASDAGSALTVPSPAIDTHWKSGLHHLKRYSQICLDYFAKPGINASYALAELTLAGKNLNAAYEGLRREAAKTSSVVLSAPPSKPKWPTPPPPPTGPTGSTTTSSSVPAPGSVLYQSAGNGGFTTPSFTTPADWTLTYTYDCTSLGAAGKFEVTAVTSGGAGTDTGSSLLANAMAMKGGDTAAAHNAAGSTYLTISSTCDWTVTAKG